MNTDTIQGILGLAAGVGLAIVWAHVVTYFLDVFLDRRYYPAKKDIDVEAYARSFVDHLGKASDEKGINDFIEMVRGSGGVLHHAPGPGAVATSCGQLFTDGHTDNKSELVALLGLYTDVIRAAPELTCPECDEAMGFTGKHAHQ